MERASRDSQARAVLGAALVVAILSFLLTLLLRRRKRKLNLPPRPFPTLPLFGDVLYLRSLRTSLSMKPLSNQLGPIFTLKIGGTTMIFVTSSALAHEALVEKGRLFAARPQLPSRALFTSNFRNISSATYGPHWRVMRRNLVHEMLSMSNVMSFAPVRNRILQELVSRISAEAQQNEGFVVVYANVRMAMFQLLLFMCFGFDIPPEAVLEISDLIEEILAQALGNLAEFYPFLPVFYKKRQQRARTLRTKQVQLLKTYIEKHKELDKLGELGAGSYLETLLHMDAETALSIDDIATLCTEFLVGGIDTTATTLEWVMARLVVSPQIQSKLYSQMLDVVGDRLVEEGDLPNLTYLQAVIKETLRLHPPGHYLLPHAVSEPCKLGGYDVPINAIVQFHIASMSWDKEIWDEPSKFTPERFLSKDVDVTGIKEIRMMPFGAGRRICPGLGLASMHLELFVARLVQAFVWAHPSESTINLDGKRGFTVRMKCPLRALVKERCPKQSPMT